MTIPRCPGNARHWYSFYGMPGYRSPVCVRCGHPNPRPLTDADWTDLIRLRQDSQLRSWVSVWGPAREAFEKAIRAQQEETPDGAT